MDAPFLTLRRERLDHLLLQEALRRGARLRTGRVTALELKAGEVRAQLVGSSSPVRARFALVATGADVSLLRSLDGVLRPEPSGVAIRAYLRSDAPPVDELVFAWDRRLAPGYAWIFPLGDGAYNVGVGIFHRNRRTRALEPHAAFDSFLRDFPLVRQLMRGGAELGPVRGARLRVGLGGVRPVTAGRVLAVGDTIAASFPFTAEGIGKALETGWLAAGAVAEALESGDDSAAAQYAMAVERLRPRYAGYEAAARWLSLPWLADLVIRRAARSPALRQGVLGILEESVDPRRVISVRGVLRSLAG